MTSNKHPVSWHEECLRNHRSFVAEIRAKLERLAQELKRSEESLAFSERQLERAKDEGLDSYDSDRFNVPVKSRSK